MEVSEESLRDRYSQMDTHELIELSASGNLTDIAAAVLEDVIAERGIKSLDRGRIVDQLELEQKLSNEIDKSLASISARIVAQIIDSIVAALILFVPVFILKDEVEDLFLIILIAYLGYLLFQDALPNGQSIGKRVMKLSVVNIKTGKPCSFIGSAVRNAFLLFFGIIDLLLILSRYKQRLGDKVASTVVIKEGKNIFTGTEVAPNTAPKRFPW